MVLTDATADGDHETSGQRQRCGFDDVYDGHRSRQYDIELCDWSAHGHVPQLHKKPHTLATELSTESTFHRLNRNVAKFRTYYDTFYVQCR